MTQPADRRDAWRPGPLSHNELRRSARLTRRRLAELIGSSRYSRPALYGLDDVLDAYLPRTGVFVEAGANDGYTQSNTYALERKGWTGLLIEPFPHLASIAARIRKHSTVVNAALVEDGQNGQRVTIGYADLMSTLDDDTARAAEQLRFGREVTRASRGEVRVIGRTLASLFDEHGLGHVDLLSLDLEGHEAPALRGLDLTRHAPTFVLVEANDAASVHAALGDRYELVAEPTDRDRLYRRIG